MPRKAPTVRTPPDPSGEALDPGGKVGRRIQIYLLDHGGRWFSAKVLDVRPELDWANAPTVTFLCRFDSDGKAYDLMLDKKSSSKEGVHWRYMGEGDEPDKPGDGVLQLPSHLLALQEQPSNPSHTSASTSTAAKRPSADTSGETLSSKASRSTVPTARLPAAAAGTRQLHDPVSQCVEGALEAVLARTRNEAVAEADDLPIMRKLRTCEWFAGSGRLSFALSAQGCEVMIHDRNPDAVEWAEHGVQRDEKLFCSKEFLEINLIDLYKATPYDYMHFSIDCSSFSGLGHTGQRRTEANLYLGDDSLRAQDGNKLFSHTLLIIEQQIQLSQLAGRPFLFTIENPYTGRMKDHPLVSAKLEVSVANGGLGAKRLVVDYCRFWDGKGSRPFHKRTIIWTNSPSLIREFGEHKPNECDSYYVCNRFQPCQWHGRLGHRAVDGRTSREATPFPPLLVSRIAQAVTLDLSGERWRPLVPDSR